MLQCWCSYQRLQGLLHKKESRKGSYTAKVNTSKQQSWVEQVTWIPRSSTQGELDVLRLEQLRAGKRKRKDAWASHKQRHKEINKTARQKTCGKFRQRELIQVSFNDPVVSCNRTRLTMIRESNPWLRLPKWKMKLDYTAKSRIEITIRGVFW